MIGASGCQWPDDSMTQFLKSLPLLLGLALLSVTIAMEDGRKQMPKIFGMAGRNLGARGFRLFWYVLLPASLHEQYGAVVLAGMTPDELQGLLQSVCGLEADLLAELRSRGLATAPQLALRDTEAETIRKALEQYRWNITEAAGALGIGRNTLYRKIRQFGLEKQ